MKRFAGRSLLLLLMSVLIVTGCSVPASPGGGTSGDGVRTVSYAGAADGLPDDPVERTDQVRDWARVGLAGALGMDASRIAAALGDTTPLRDSAFDQLLKQPTGPGRALDDGRGTLHLLVPEDDPHRSRTIGLLLDQHLTETGSDTPSVQVHRYLDQPESRTVRLTAEDPVPVAQAREDNGWFESRVDDEAGLNDFLGRSTGLSRVERRGTEIWASGWAWPDDDGAHVTAEDVSVLQRSYRGTGPTLPGFSLDPGPRATADDLRAAAPDLAPDLFRHITTGDYAGSGFASADDLADIADRILLGQTGAPAPGTRGLPADRTQLWALYHYLSGSWLYSEARYDGGIAGTEIGATLFYTDMVAKNWVVAGSGTGLPTGVPGFVPDPAAVTPSSLCPQPGDPTNETGRLWFGQNQAAFRSDAGRILIGDQATRLYNRSDGATGEVEPSFESGRGLRWWSEHYQAVADYEQQYRRLEQLMRWSAAVEWLSTSDPALPQLPDSAIRSDIDFPAWYRDHDELRERAPLPLIPPRTAGGIALLPTPSASSTECGNFLRFSGGVSLADRGRAGEQSYDAVTRTRDGTSVTATGRPLRFDRLADARILPNGDPRTAATQVTGTPDSISFAVSHHGEQFATLDVAPGVTVTRLFLHRQRQVDVAAAGPWLTDAPARGPPPLFVLTGFGTTRLRTNDGIYVDAFTQAPSPLPGTTTYLHGVPGGPGSPPTPLYLRARDSAPDSSAPAIAIQPPTTPNGPATVSPSGVPPRPDAVIFVGRPDGPPSRVVRSGGIYYVASGDPVLGLRGPADIARALQDLPRLEAAMKRAGQGPGRLVVSLGDDGFALVSRDGILVPEAGSAVARRVRDAVDPSRPDADTYVRLDGGTALHVDDGPFQQVTTSTGTFGEFVDDLGPGAGFYAADREGRVAAAAPPSGRPTGAPVTAISRDARVTVRVVVRETPSEARAAPDVVVFNGREWFRAVTPGGGGTPPGGAPGTGGPPGAGGYPTVLYLVSQCDPNDPDQECS